MTGEKNLIPMNKRTKEEQKEIVIQGGKASGKARREKKLFRDIIEQLLTSKAPLPLKEMLKNMGFETGKQIDCLEALLKICLSKSTSSRTNLGHLTRFLEFAYEAIGEKKTDTAPAAQIMFIDKDDVKEANDHIDRVLNKAKIIKGGNNTNAR